jgi:hypothetical protein
MAFEDKHEKNKLEMEFAMIEKQSLWSLLFHVSYPINNALVLDY